MQRLWPVVVPVLLASFVWAGWAYQRKVSKGGFWSMPDEEKITFFMRMPEGTDIRVVSETMEKFEALVLPLDPGVTMKTQVFGNSAFMEVEYEDELKQGPIPYFHRNALVELADNTGGSRIYIGGFSDQPYFRGGMMGNSSNSLIKLTGYNSKRLNESVRSKSSKATDASESRASLRTRVGARPSSKRPWSRCEETRWLPKAWRSAMS
jgi:multidrug efflux pump subunit AcrB